jgi:CHAD domain-containing protein
LLVRYANFVFHAAVAYRKKFHIAGLKRKLTFSESARPVLSHLFRRVCIRAKKYSGEPGEEMLHNLRIALRRFRYSLELYVDIIKPRRFREIYELAVELQNLLGERRDLDVMELKLKNIFNTAGNPVPAAVLDEMQIARATFDRQIAEKLPKFTGDRQIHKLIGE